MSKRRDFIYKYTSITDFTYKNLILSQLRFNPPTLMNDQLEGIVKVKNKDFKPSTTAIENFIREKGMEEHLWSLRSLNDQDNFLDFYMSYWFRFKLSKYRITCFSRSSTESLMWAHYADKHSGICLVYDKNILMESLTMVDQTFKLISINYGVKPTITLWEKDNRIGYESDIPIISAKDSNWRYEKEVRIYNEHNENERFYGDSYFVQNSALLGVIYGYQISESDKDAISMILRNEPHYKGVFEAEEKIDLESGKIIIE